MSSAIKGTKSTPDEPATIDGRTLRLIPTPGRRKAQLNTLEGVRREMSRVYRDAEAGERDSAEASKLVYILGQIGRVLEVVEIETRLRALEGKANGERLFAPHRGA
jgi:hypothetical protein